MFSQLITKKSLFFLTISILIGYYFSDKFKAKSLSDGAPLSLPVTIKSSGAVQGFLLESRSGREFSAFLGLPYAEPPLGDLRFESPQPLTKKWEGIRLATEFGNECIQVQPYRTTTRGSEDCLYLNVYTPHKLGEKDASQKLFPVLVYIHGGLFVYGSGNAYLPHYFLDHDVILVTLNYRLGVFGFLNTEDKHVRGNMGLKDQVMAFKWIQENIESFGGDSKRVTIFGESAGGASVHYHMLSPMSKNLFHQGISQSGVVLNPWALQPTPSEQLESLTKTTNCTSSTMKKTVECLKSISAETLAQATRDVNEPLRHPNTAFVPTREVINDEHAFLTGSPETLLKSNPNHVPWLNGVNSHEGLVVTPTLFAQALLSKFSTNLKEDFSNILWFNKPTSIKTLEQIKQYYLGEEPLERTVDKFDNWTNLIGDSYFTLGHHSAVQLILANNITSPTYLYYYTYQGQMSLAELLFALKGQLPLAVEYISHFGWRWIEKNVFGREIPHAGSSHFDEVALLFPLKGIVTTDVHQAHQDYEMSRRMVKAWVTFVEDHKTLNWHGTKWPKLSPTVDKQAKVKYMQIDKEHSIVEQPFHERMKFWESLQL